MKTLTIKPSPLCGRIHIPPSKSMTHRAIICAFLSKGESRIDNVELSDDIIATCRAAEALGGEIDILESAVSDRKKLVIRGKGGITIKNHTIDCGESGTTARFIIPISRLSSEQVTVTGRGRLIDRPFNVFYDLFDAHGIPYQTMDGKLPVTFGGELKPGNFRLRGDISSQFISGLLLTLPLLPGVSNITVTTPLESAKYIDMTLEMQKLFGIRIDYDREENQFTIPGWQTYKPQDYQVEGDWSQAAFWLAAGILSGPIELEGLNPDSLQGDKVIETLFNGMGAALLWDNGILEVRKNKLHGIEMDVSQCPDLVPVLAVLGAIAHGETELYNAARLRIKECDRLKAMTTELKSIGANIIEMEDSLKIEGVEMLSGGRVYGWNDHRIVMAMAIAAVLCQRNMTIEGCEAVNKSYPSFWEHYRSLGGVISEQHMG